MRTREVGAMNVAVNFQQPTTEHSSAHLPPQWDRRLLGLSNVNLS